jgi:hypothetical protein
MFTDIVRSTDLIGVIGDDAWEHLLTWHDRTLPDTDDELGFLDIVQTSRADQLRESPRRAPGRSDSSWCPKPSSRTACQKAEIGERSPAWSQTHAATRPPDRVTRAISASPATGSVMKWTTSCARAASNSSTRYGRYSADASRTSTPGYRLPAASTKDGDGSTAETAASPAAPTSSAVKAPGPHPTSSTRCRHRCRRTRRRAGRAWTSTGP